MASVRKRTYKDGSVRFVVDFKDDRGNRALKTFEHKKAATAFRDKVVREVQEGKYLPRRDEVSFTQGLENWFAENDKRVRRGHLTNATIRAYKCDVVRAVPFFSKRKLSDISTAHIQEMIDTLILTLTPCSVEHTVTRLYSLFSLALENGTLRVNPVNYKKLSLPKNDKIVQIPPKEALRAIMVAVEAGRKKYRREVVHANRAVAVTLALFGTMRRGEIAGLQWGDIDFASGIIRIERSRSPVDGVKTTKTKAGVRSFVMAPPIRAALRQLLDTRAGCFVGPDDYVLLGTAGRPREPSSIYYCLWRPTLIEAGLMGAGDRTPFRFHSLRHAAASLLIERGVSPMHVKTMMGHASIKTTIDVYGHLFPSDQTLAIASAQIAADLSATHTRHDRVTH